MIYSNLGILDNFLSGKEIGNFDNVFLDIVKFDDIEYKFKIFDTAGHERFRSISLSAVKISDGIILVFSVAKKQTFELIYGWIQSIKDYQNKGNLVIF